MHKSTIATGCLLLLAQLAFAQENLQPIPQNGLQLQPAPLSIQPIRVGEPTPAKRPAPAKQPDPATAPNSQTKTAEFIDTIPTSSDVTRAGAQVLVETTVPEKSPATLLRRALAITNDQIDGPTRPIALREALDRAAGRGQQMEVVKSYWQLFAAVADYNHAWGESQFLAGLPAAQVAHEQALLRRFQSASQARAHEAHLALVAAQEDLTTAARLSDSDSPFPSDFPFIGAYRTRYESLFRGRTAPAEIRRIHRTLPYYLTLIGSRGTATEDAEASLTEAVRAYESGNVTLQSVLDAFIHLRDQRIAFVATVRDYNRAIASYALNVTSAGLSRDRVVAMLINSRPATKSVLVPTSEVQPAAAVESDVSNPRWNERDGVSATKSGELVPVKPQPGAIVAPPVDTPANLTAPEVDPPIAPIDGGGFRLRD